MSHVWLMSRSKQLQQLAAQLASLASLEDVVTRGLQSLLESSSRLVAPIFCGAGSACRASGASVPLAFFFAQSCSRRPQGSILLSHRGPTGLTVKSFPAAPPDRQASTHGRSGSPASAADRSEPQIAAGATSVSAPSAAVAPRLLIPVLLPPGRLIKVVLLSPLRCDVTPNGRCGVRFSIKTSLGLQCGPAAPIQHLMMMCTTPTMMRFVVVRPCHRGAGAAVPFVGARRALPRIYLLVRPGHFHYDPTGLT